MATQAYRETGTKMITADSGMAQNEETRRTVNARTDRPTVVQKDNRILHSGENQWTPFNCNHMDESHEGNAEQKTSGHQRTLIPFSRSSGRLAFDCEGYLGRAAKGVDAEERWLSVGAYDVLLFSVTSVRTKL